MNPDFFVNNRRQLSQAIGGGLTIVSAYRSQQRANDASFKFEQEANFWYLCGIAEPDWMLVNEGSNGHSWLIMPDIDEVHRIFDGGMSAEEAQRISGANTVVDAKEGQDLLRRLAKNHPLAYSVGVPPHADYFSFSLNPSVQKNWAMLERTFGQVQDCRKELSKLRAIKQPEEQAMIQKAVDVSVGAFKKIHANLAKYKNEYEIEADFARNVRFAGASGCAYDSIVASGLNACTLHYNTNASTLRNRELVLMDMGAQYGGYAADITRTYSKGAPTKRQHQVHSAVETAHHRIINIIEPMLSVESYQSQVNEIMSEALESIGLGSDEAGLHRYFPHAISHGLGIDVHDSLGAPKYFQEGMVLTVEPGIYIPEEKIGVRIEDDILITATGRKNLSAALPTGL